MITYAEALRRLMEKAVPVEGNERPVLDSTPYRLCSPKTS